MSRFHRIYRIRHYERVRLAVLLRDAYRCGICGEGDALTDPATTLDHVVPLSKGGTNALSNLRAAHHRCNSSRKAKDDMPRARIAARWQS